MQDLDTSLSEHEAQLVADRDAALLEVKRKPTGANRTAYRKAAQVLEEFLRAKAEPASAEQVFASVLEVVEHLDAEGWKISKSSAYEHWKKDGKLKARPDGSFSLSAVMEYASNHLQRKDGRTGAGGEDLSRQKTAAEVRRITSDAELRELKLRTALGEVMSKSDVEAALAERASSLQNYLNAVARSSAGRIIKLVGGDPQKAPELIAFMLGANRKAMDNYSRPIEGLEDDDF